MVLVPAGVVGLLLPDPLPLLLLPPPPQAETTRPSPASNTIAQNIFFHLRRAPKSPPSPNRTTASKVFLSSGPNGDGACSGVTATFVAIVSVDVAVLPFGVTEDGEKLHVLAAGKPEQAKLTVWLNPFCGVTVIVVVPDWPGLTLTDVGLKLTLKLGPFTVCVSAADVDPAKFASPPYTAVIECDPVLSDDVL
jgi:hypothetical protein